MDWPSCCIADASCLGTICPGPSPQLAQVPLSALPTERQATIIFPSVGPNNPVYTPSDYSSSSSSDPNAPTVSFEGLFQGQSWSFGGPVNGNPSPPLALDPSGPDTITSNWFIITNCLFGDGQSGPIAILLSRPVSAIGVSPTPGAIPLSQHAVGCQPCTSICTATIC